jgi:hypothetical protein
VICDATKHAFRQKYRQNGTLLKSNNLYLFEAAELTVEKLQVQISNRRHFDAGRYLRLADYKTRSNRNELRELELPSVHQTGSRSWVLVPAFTALWPRAKAKWVLPTPERPGSSTFS